MSKNEKKSTSYTSTPYLLQARNFSVLKSCVRVPKLKFLLKKLKIFRIEVSKFLHFKVKKSLSLHQYTTFDPVSKFKLCEFETWHDVSCIRVPKLKLSTFFRIEVETLHFGVKVLDENTENF